MARMLGKARFRPADPRDDNLALDSRVARRQQRRREYHQWAAGLFPEADEQWLATLGPLYDLSDCEHGCSGWPCGSERCTFICHEGLPVKT